MKKRMLFRILFIIVSTIIISGEVFAAEILRAVSGQDAVRLYVKGTVGMVTSASYQMGDQSIQELHPKFITEDTTPIRTLLLIDNSLSIPYNKRSEVKEILKGLVQGHAQNEQFRLSTFSETINYLSDYTVDYSSLERSIDSIEFINQKTYLTDVLYDVLNDAGFNTYDGFQRIVVISDGDDNKRITREELNNILRTDPYPVYTIGIDLMSNNAELENMFALSRITNVDSYILGHDDVSKIIGGISSDYSILVFTANIPESMKNGGTINSRLTLSDGTMIEKTVRLPFADNSNSSSTTITSQADVNSAETSVDSAESSLSNEDSAEDEETENGETDEGNENEEQSFFSKYLIFFIVGGIILIVFAVLVRIIVGLKRSKSVNEPVPDNLPSKDNFYMEQNISKKLNNELIPDNFAIKDTLFVGQNLEKDEDIFTVPVNKDLDGYNGKQRFALIVTDIKDGSKTFRKEIDGQIVIGRSRTAEIHISYDESVSRQQCTIIEKGDKFYVENLAKTNPTRLNNIVVNTPQVINSGDLLNMGNLTVRVDFEKL